MHCGLIGFYLLFIFCKQILFIDFLNFIFVFQAFGNSRIWTRNDLLSFFKTG